MDIIMIMNMDIVSKNVIQDIIMIKNMVNVH